MPTDDEIWERINLAVDAYLAGERCLQTGEKEISMWLYPGRTCGGTVPNVWGWDCRELDVVLNLQVLLVRSHRKWRRDFEEARFAPALQLDWYPSQYEKPDWWGYRWREAVRKTDVEMVKGIILDPMVAVVGHPVWLQLSELGRPFPPFFPLSLGGAGISPWLHRLGWKEAKAVGMPSWACNFRWRPPVPDPWPDGGRLSLGEWMAVRVGLLKGSPPQI